MTTCVFSPYSPSRTDGERQRNRDMSPTNLVRVTQTINQPNQTVGPSSENRRVVKKMNKTEFERRIDWNVSITSSILIKTTVSEVVAAAAQQERSSHSSSSNSSAARLRRGTSPSRWMDLRSDGRITGGEPAMQIREVCRGS